jgi:hypothetical protein
MLRLKETKSAVMCYDISLKRAREDRHKIPLPFLILKCISHNKILKCVSGTYHEEVALSSPIYVFLFFVFFVFFV